MKRFAGSCAVGAMTLAVGACGPEPEEWPIPDEAASWSLGDRPFLTIGADEGNPSAILYGVVGAVLLESGEIAVANAGTSEVLFFSRNGQRTRAAGGKGRGPDEFVYIAEMGRMAGDSLLVYDGAMRSVSLLSPEGRVVERAQIQERISQLSGPCRLGEGGVSFLPNGSVLLELEDNFGVPGCPSTPEEAWRASELVAVLDWRSGEADTLGVFPGPARYGHDYQIYGAVTATAVLTGALVIGDLESERIATLALDGAPLGSFPAPFRRRPVPEDMRGPGRVTRIMTSALGRRAVEVEYHHPELLPAYSRLLGDRAGALWVAAYPRVAEPLATWHLMRPPGAELEGEQVWRILDTEGEIVAQMMVPRDVFVLDVTGDTVLGLTLGENDVEVLNLYAIERG